MPKRTQNQRRRRWLQRVGAAALFLLLAFFWWSVVYTFLVAGWWLIAGYSFGTEAPNGYVYNGPVDWVLMIVALLTLWPVQRALRTRIAHLIDALDNRYEVISRLSAELDAAPTDSSPMAVVTALLAETLNVPYVSIESTRDELSATFGTPTAVTPISLPLRYNDQPLGTLQIAPRVVAGVPVAVDERLMGDLARQVSVTLFAAQASADLQESRRRIVTARRGGPPPAPPRPP